MGANSETMREFGRQLLQMASRGTFPGTQDAESFAVCSMILQKRWRFTFEEAILFLGPFFEMDEVSLSDLTGLDRGHVRKMTKGYGRVRGRVSLLSRLDPETGRTLSRFSLQPREYCGVIPRQDAGSPGPFEWRPCDSEDSLLVRAAVRFLALESRAGLEPEEALLYIRPEFGESWDLFVSDVRASMGKGTDVRRILDRAERKVAEASSGTDVFLGCPPAAIDVTNGLPEPMPESPAGDSVKLSEIVSVVADELGYGESVTARFVAYRNPGVIPLVGTEGSVDLTYSDYFASAPEDVLSALARSHLTTTEEDDRREEGMKAIFRWYSSDRFRTSVREMYMRRNRGLRASGEGDCKNLCAIAERMAEEGAIPPHTDADLMWSDDCGETSYMTSPVVGIVSVPGSMDRADVPDEAVEYVLSRGIGQISAFEGIEEAPFPKEKEKVAERWLAHNDYHAWDGSARSDLGSIEMSWAEWIWEWKQRSNIE